MGTADAAQGDEEGLPPGQLVTRCSVGLRPEQVRWPGTAR